MPGWMSGIDLARQAAKKWPDICIMITSAYYTDEDGELPDNVTLFPKPFSPDALLKEVKLRLRR
jgi:DNA-binding response OmpR family regulator